VAVHDSGRIINPGESQVKGGATVGIGMALHEELLYDAPPGCRSPPAITARAS
jgi:CO/xanthine dehydrogenase Mo-binding subunit